MKSLKLPVECRLLFDHQQTWQWRAAWDIDRACVLSWAAVYWTTHHLWQSSVPDPKRLRIEQWHCIWQKQRS